MSEMKDILTEADVEWTMQAIASGDAIPPLYIDVIAKTVFSADVHPDRLNFLMRGIALDDTIDVRSSAANEGFRKSIHSKGLVTDIPAWLRDGTLGDVEVQKVAQEFIFTRLEMYSSDMLLLQYSVEAGQAKKEVDYGNVNEVLVIVLMVESPKPFKEHDEICEKYIHRFLRNVSDTGLSYPTKRKMIYVQLDKCLEQYKKGENAEAEDNRPDRLQLLLAMIADTNNPNVVDDAKKDVMMDAIRKEAFNMSQDKKVQGMLSQELYERMSWNSHFKAGVEQGLNQGLNQGEQMHSALTSALLDSGRVEDLKRSTCDVEFRKQLYNEFGIGKTVSEKDAVETSAKPEAE